MNKNLMGLLVVAALGLSACGGTGAKNGSAQGHSLGSAASGGTSNAASGDTSSNSSSSNTTTDTSTSSSTPTNRLYGLHAAVTTQHVDNGMYFANSGDTTLNMEGINNIDELEIDGRRIALIPKGKSTSNGFYESPKDGEAIYTGTSTAPYAQDTSKSWRKIATDLKYARYGEIHDEYEKHHVVVTGFNTPSDKMPTANEEVVYKGKALHNKDTYTAARDNTRPFSADAEFRVNFHEHTLAGTIKPRAGASADEQFTPISLKGKIEGNTFEGTDSARVDNNYTILTTDKGEKERVFTPAHTKGAFYGPNAEEMAGVYMKITGENEIVQPDGTIIYPRNTTHGTYGVSKQ